jgi:acetoin utilization protein AcuB
MTLEEIMSEHIVKVTEDTDVSGAAHIMLRHRINGMVVVRRDDPQKIAGLITTNDLLRIMGEILDEGHHQRINELKEMAHKPVSDLMSRDVATMQKCETVLKAIVFMHNKRLSTLPILDGDRLVGIIGRHDILNIALA